MINLLLFSFVFGLMIGSFLNCFIWRIHKKESLWNRSYCPSCKNKIFWYDNIPVLSFLFLRGKCRNCRDKISLEYPLVELTTAILFSLAFYFNWVEFFVADYSFLIDGKFILSLVKSWFIIFICVSIFIYDLRWFLIPDIIILPAILIISLFNLLLGYSVVDILLPAIVGGGFFLIQFLVSRGKWIGGGDIRFGAFMGAAIAQLSTTLLSLLIAYWLGSIVGVFLIISKKKAWSSEVPLGVFLSVSMIISIFIGKNIIAWYFTLLSF